LTGLFPWEEEDGGRSEAKRKSIISSSACIISNKAIEIGVSSNFEKEKANDETNTKDNVIEKKKGDSNNNNNNINNNDNDNNNNNINNNDNNNINYALSERTARKWRRILEEEDVFGSGPEEVLRNPELFRLAVGSILKAKHIQEQAEMELLSTHYVNK